MRRAKTIVYFLSALLLAGCERDAAEEVSPADGEHPLLFTATIAGGDSGGLSVGTRAGEEVGGIPVKELDETRNALLKKTFTKGDAIRISNVASGSASANFDLNDPHCFQYVYEQHNHVPGDDTDDPTYVEGSTDEDQYAQDHFNPSDHSDDGWSEYLFKPVTVDDTERGFYLSNLITDGNSYFRFYACLYKDAYGNSLPVVKTDQSKEEDFLNSDALFAHTGHHINSVDKPIRLIFYHAHAMLDVRLVLPTYKDGYKKKDEMDQTEEKLPSGYKEDDVQLCLTNVKTNYRIAWAMQSDAGKMVPTTFDDDVDRVKEIPMYRYYVEEGDGHMEKDSDDTESESSEYRTYGYCAIVPAQNMPTETGLSTATDLPLLRLYVKNPITGEKESYVYIPDNKPVETSTTGFSLEQGEISVLYLKLSRTANDRLTVIGDIQQWDRASGSMEALKDEGQDKAAGKQEG